MIQRLYVHNFRCLENFELILKELPSALLIGKNGTGKSTVSHVLEIFQSISRGVNRVGQLVKPEDFTHRRYDIPIRFEIEVLYYNKLYKYVLALELPEKFKELRVFEESLIVDEEPIYSRKEAQITLHHNSQNREDKFFVDWHLVALPIIQVRSATDPLHILKTWLASMIILAPSPSLMTGESDGDTLYPKRDCSNFGEWVSGLLIRYPAAYTTVHKYIRVFMPDFQQFQNEVIGKDSKSMIVKFEANNNKMPPLGFKYLSDGEKCFFLCAVVLAAEESYGPIFCFWDEPDNYVTISEAGHFIISLQRAFKERGQLLVTSHNSQAIEKFSNENTFFFDRKNHLEPTLVRLISEIPVTGDLITSLICGDIEL